MTYFLKSGNRYMVSSKAAMDLHEKLPVGTYTVKQDPMTLQYYIEQIEDFEVKGKIYGDTIKTGERILNTFNDRTGSTGVMLSGEKGSGKTLLAKMLAILAQEQGVPTIVINNPHCGEAFNGFMQMIEQPTVVIFDEFEKVYDKEEQEKMLTLLDGVYPSKKLFIITCNDKWRVNEHMRNRPGRIFYRLDYKGLENDFIVEYCEDNLKDQTHTESICRMAAVFGEFNFDMLKAMVEEMNRYDESPHEVMKLLNAKPEFSESSQYKINLVVDGEHIGAERMYNEQWRGNPLNNDVVIEYMDGTTDADGDTNWGRARFSISDLASVEAGSGRFQFENALGNKVSLTKVSESKFDWSMV